MKPSTFTPMASFMAPFMAALVASLVAALAVVAAVSNAARAAELVVIASTGSEIEIGSVLDGGTTIQLAAGAAVTLVSADGRTLKFTGPYSGAPDAAPGTGDTNLLDALSDIVAPAEQDVSTAGIMRASIYAPKEPWVIDSGQSGTHCVLPDRPAPLWRPIAIGAVSASLKAAEGQATVTWQDGSYTAPWPADLTIADGASYELVFTLTGKTRRLSIHQVPEDLPDDLARAIWMHDRGCTPQAKALLAGL